METARERIAAAISHQRPGVTPVNVMGFEDVEPWLERFGAHDVPGLWRALAVDAFPDAPPVYRGPPLEPGLDIWGASYSWTGFSGAGYSGGRGGFPLAGIVHLPGNDPRELKREYGGDITFYGGINSQSTLPYGTIEQVRAEVRDRVRVLGKGGGYICSSDHTILPGVPFENVLAMIDEARKTRP